MIRTFALALAATTMLAMPATAAPKAGKSGQAAQQPAPLPAPAPLAQLVRAVDIPYEQFTLPNGLRVIVHTDRKAPVVAVSVWYDVGSKHEPAGRTGFAHLFEHLMFNGTENSPGDWFAPLRAIGGTDLNGTTSFDRTNYFQTVPRAALDRILYLESDRMGHLLGAVTQAVLDEQRGVVQNEKRQGDNQPYGMVRYAINEGLFPEGHPYRHSVIGSMADLQAASLNDVRSWFRRHYGPNNAVLVLAGDITAAEARPLVERYFGNIARGPQTVAPNAPVPTLDAPKRMELKDRVATTRIYRMWAVPGLTDKQATDLDVAAGVFGGLSSSRLDNALVRRERLAVNVAAFNQSFSQVGIFGVQVDVRPGVDPKQVEQRLDQLFAEYLRDGPTAEEVSRYATSTAAGRIGGLEQVGGFGGKAVALASGALFANDPALYKKKLAELAAATPAGVKAAMSRWLTRPAYTLTVSPGEREAYVEPPRTAPQADAAAPAAEPTRVQRGPLPEVGRINDLDFPDVQRAKLSNGIEIVYARRDAVPVTRMSMAFDAGIVADPAGKVGTGTLTLSLLEEGTTTRDSIQIAEAQERLGARIGIGSSSDRSFVSLYAPSTNLAGSIQLLSDVVRNPAFAQSEIDRQRNRLLARIAQERTSPNGLGNLALAPRLFAGSLYANTGQGSGDPAAVQALTRDDLVAHHRAWIRPEKATIFVVSDRPLAEIQAALEAGFGNWQGEGAPGSKTATSPQPVTPRIILVDRPNSPQSLILAGQITPLQSRGELLPALTVNDVLGGDFTSRINMDLREAKGWSYGSRGNFNRLESVVAYTIAAPVQADKTGPAIQSLRNEVTAFLTNRGVTPEEFDRTVTGNIRELAGNFETGNAVLGAMQTNHFFGRPDNYYDTIAQRYRALTPQALDAAARGALDPNKFIWVVVGDAASVRPQLDSLGLPVEVIAAPPAARPAAPAARPAQ